MSDLYERVARALKVPCDYCAGKLEPGEWCGSCNGQRYTYPLLEPCPERPGGYTRGCVVCERQGHPATCPCHGTGLVPRYATLGGERIVPLALLLESAAKAGHRIGLCRSFDPPVWSAYDFDSRSATDCSTSAPDTAVIAAMTRAMGLEVEA